MIATSKTSNKIDSTTFSNKSKTMTHVESPKEEGIILWILIAFAAAVSQSIAAVFVRKLKDVHFSILACSSGLAGLLICAGIVTVRDMGKKPKILTYNRD